MALQYNYYTTQDDFPREARIRVYAYEKYPLRERSFEDRQRYPSVYKLFNNRPSFGDTSAPKEAYPNETSRSVSPYPYVGNQTTFPPQNHVITHMKAYPETVDEPVNYHSPRSPQPHVGIQTHVPLEKAKFIGNSSQIPVPSNQHIVTHPKAYPKTVESVKHVGVPEKSRLVGREVEIGRDDKKQEGDVGEEQWVDSAAAGFIEWKLRTLKMCKA